MFRGLLLAVLFALVLILSAHTPVRAADPSPAATPGASPVLVDPLDPRAGEGASQVGAPLTSILFVFLIGTVSVVATVAFVRVTRRT